MAVMWKWVISWEKGREEGLVGMEMWNEPIMVNMVMGMLGMRCEKMGVVMGVLGYER